MDVMLECKVLSVYDGDTITVALPFCGKLFKTKCRLLGIDSPEIRTKDAIEKVAAVLARDWLRSRIGGRRVWLQCKGYDKYGRLLANVFEREQEAQTHQGASGSGSGSINSLMVTHGHAVEYDGGTKKPFHPN